MSRSSSRLVALAFVVGLIVLTSCGSSGGDGSGSSEPADSSTTAAVASLAGTAWTLQPSSLGVVVPDGVTVTLAFTQDQLSGNSGCNRYSGGYTTPGRDGLAIGPLMSTKMACEKGPAGVESAYLARLDQVRRYAITGDLLTLADDIGNTLLTFTADAGKPAN